MNYIKIAFIIYFLIIFLYVAAVESEGTYELTNNDGWEHQKATYPHTFVIFWIGLIAYVFLGAIGLLIPVIPQHLIILYNKYIR